MLAHIFTRRYAHHHAMLIVFLASALWGILWMPMRYTESFGLSGLWVVTMFHLLPACAICPFVMRACIADRQHWFVTALAGGSMGVGFVLYGLGLVVASVTKTTVLFYLTPVWATLLAYVLLSERFGFGRWLAIVGGVTGCLLVMRVNPLAFGYDNADLLGLIAGVAWAAGSVVIRRYPKADFLHITSMQYLIGGLLAGGAAIVMGDAIPAISHVLAALPVAFLASAVVFLPSVLLIFRIMQYLSPGLVGILMLSEVLVAALSSWVFLHETLTPWQWGGVVAILGIGVFVGLTETSAESD
ncbi:MAG: DMT family transporter [Candidatus Puniceispirillaceae bacterium]